MDSDATARLYNDALVRLSEQVPICQRLSDPMVTATAISPICGSEVTVDLSIENGHIAAFGFEVEACALTRAVLAVMYNVCIGKTRQDIQTAGTQLRSMLENHAKPPVGDWADLKVLEPVRDYTARHNAVLLPFVAVEKAFAQYERTKKE